LLLCPRPQATRFPYTTLFRSAHASHHADHRLSGATATVRAMTTIEMGGVTIDCADPRKLAEFWTEALGTTIGGDYGEFIFLAPKDRKSTRLNSSHSQISYAVF